MLTPEQVAKANTEHAHQAALFMWANLCMRVYPELEWMYAIPNGGMRDKITAGKLKAEGVKSGVSDVCLPVRRGCYSGLYVEMKKPAMKPKRDGSKGGVSDDQHRFGYFVQEQGFGFVVCYSWKEASEIIIWYLNLKLC